jgi:hypothetical protein
LVAELELAHGYGEGFLAVFAAALALRLIERRSSNHDSLHAFAEQIDRLGV